MEGSSPRQKLSGVSEHAGFPNPATDNLLEDLSLQQLLIKHPVSTFFLRVRGSEWEGQGIFDGDIAIVDRALTARKSDLVIWWQGDNFVISKQAKKPDDCPAWGVVTSIIHQCRKS